MTDSDFEAALEIVERLVAAPSPNPPGDERAVAAVITEAATGLGLPAPQILQRHQSRPNLLFTLGGGPPNLILAAHTDTVPPGDESAWRTNPYRLERREDRLIGLGVADMKAAIAAIMVGGSRWLSDSSRRGTLSLLFVADEENGSHFGARWLAERGMVSGDAAILMEPASFGPHSWEQFFVAQRGSCLVWLEAHGDPGHSGAPRPPARQASNTFAKALTALLEADLFSNYRHPIDGTRANANIATMVEGGTVPFAYPETLRAAIDVRTLDGMRPENVIDEIEGVLRSAGLTDDVSVRLAPGATGWIEAGPTTQDKKLVDAARAAWAEVIGPVPAPAVLTATTDSAWLSRAHIPTLPALGPGSLGIAHQPNEWLQTSDLSRSIDLVAELARNFTGVEN